METTGLRFFNTLSRKKEEFVPIAPPNVGLYVCGPTVYGDAHLGHAKSYVSFDIMYRYLMYLGYKVKYIQNITDVGHLTDDADEGDDKISKQSRLEQLDPMQIVEMYMANYYRDMDALNVLRPAIAPRPSGHIQEQIEAIEGLIEKGYAYVESGSVYFDVPKYNESHHYGKLSGRTLDDMKEGAANRELDKQSEKHSPFDFALWKHATEEHLMQWNSPWGKGYPGWHIECSVMSQKYLGENFDIHGGGLENTFPHHECEIAQAEGLTDKPFANYWIHNNMVTVNGQKMGKSLGNGIFCHELFSGENKLLDQAYDPMTVRFFILQSHYRSTLDFSNEALKAAEKGYDRLMIGMKNIDGLNASDKSSLDVEAFVESCENAMNDDFNTPVLIAQLFEGVKWINLISSGKESLSKKDLELFQKKIAEFVYDVLGFRMQKENAGSDDLVNEVMEVVMDLRAKAKSNKDFETADFIRDELKKRNIQIRDGKEGADWMIGN